MPVFFIMSNRLTSHRFPSPDPTFLFFKGHNVPGQAMGLQGLSIPECRHLSYRDSPFLLAPELLSHQDALNRY